MKLHQIRRGLELLAVVLLAVYCSRWQTVKQQAGSTDEARRTQQTTESSDLTAEAVKSTQTVDQHGAAAPPTPSTPSLSPNTDAASHGAATTAEVTDEHVVLLPPETLSDAALAFRESVIERMGACYRRRSALPVWFGTPTL